MLKMNSRRLICGDKSGNINSWKLLKHGQRIQFDGLLVGHLSPITDIKFDETRLVSVSQTDLRVWNIQSKMCLAVYSMACPAVPHLSPKFIGIGTGDGQTILLNRNGRLVLDCPQSHQSIQFIQVLGNLLMSVSANGTIKAHSCLNGSLVWSYKSSRRIVSMESKPRGIQLNLDSLSSVQLDMATGSLIPIQEPELSSADPGFLLNQSPLEAY